MWESLNFFVSICYKNLFCSSSEVSLKLQSVHQLYSILIIQIGYERYLWIADITETVFIHRKIRKEKQQENKEVTNISTNCKNQIVNESEHSCETSSRLSNCH